MASHIIGFVLLLFSHANQDTTIDKSKLLGIDYRLFQNTPAWDLTKAVRDEDTLKIKAAVNENKSLLTSREPRFGQSILQMAVLNSNYSSVKKLLELGADPNMQDLYFGDTPVMAAVKAGATYERLDTTILNLLLKYGGNPNAKEISREKSGTFTPFTISCLYGNLDFVKILVNAGAEINAVNEYNTSALELATNSSNPELVMYLIEKGADYKRVLYKTADGKDKYITDAMREWLFDLKSEEYKKKMRLVDFLKKNGMDYWKTPIPERFLDNPKEYLEKY